MKDNEIKIATNFNVCPGCGKENEVFDEEYLEGEGYEVDGETFPKRDNEIKGSGMDGMYWDWDEHQKCPDCKQVFYYRNGAY